mgnify:CR=1 FL=1|jgi:hypothetical protein
MENYDWLEELDWVYYGHGTSAYYDSETDTYYNEFGQQLRNPNEYDTSGEGYTPFGDE